MTISPSWSVSCAPISFSRVDFPEPDGPIIMTISPRNMSRSTPCRTSFVPSPSLYMWRRPLTFMMGSSSPETFCAAFSINPKE